MANCRPYKPQKISISEIKQFDVFLSFRGPDVRKTLADHLYYSLSTAGLRVFIDSEELFKGENIERNLELAIKGSSIYIPIFSPGYASSRWCLWKVSLMWEIKSRSADTVVLIPLFYNVEPSHVRYPDHRDSPYAEAFAKHVSEGRRSQGEIQRWRNALYGVSCLSGWSLEETFFGYQGKLVKQVVEDVLQTLNVGVLDVARRPVGLTSLCEEVIQLLRLGDNSIHGRCTLDIWGMPGLGKTTLSKALYNKIHHLFDASRFVSNVKEEGSEPRLKELKQKIIRDLRKMQKEVNRKDGGITQRNNLAPLRVLVVLDDVDNVLQLDVLIGNWFGEGSRIIITTEDKHVLEARHVDEIYAMTKLEHAEAVELFCWQAFLIDHPKKGYEDLTERIVKACSGLPLSLENVGRDLYNRNEIRYWKQTLHKLEMVGNDRVFETLKISYDSLTLEVKRIFLDIACFFVNPKSSSSLRNRAFDMCFSDKFWRALGCLSVYPSLKTLEEKSLIAVHEYRYCEDPDEDIDEEEFADQYLCEFSMHEEIRRMGCRIVREESLSYPTDRSRIWQEEDIHTVIAAMTIQENSRVEGLLWRASLKHHTLRKNLTLEKKRMELQCIDSLAQLRRLNFLLWWKLQLKTEIQRLPTSLKYLVLSECQLKACSSKMATIERDSDQNGTSALSPVLPKSIIQLINLRYLDMSGTKQRCLPKEICELLCLEELYLSRCSLKALPEDFGNLIKLKTLDVSNNSLSEFPPSFQHLKSLMHLEMASNNELAAFPPLPKGLSSLNARRCSKLQVISLMYGMKSLKTMDLSHCKSITRLLQLQSCKSLRHLNVEGCRRLVELDRLPQTVTCVRTSGCSQLQNLSFTRVCVERIAYLACSLSSYREEQVGGSIWSLSTYHNDLPEKQRLCIIGCDNSHLNIYQLLKDLNHLEQLDLSVSSGEAFPGDTQPLVGQRNLTLQRGNSTVAILFCFVFNLNQRVRLPQMDVVMTFLGENPDCPYFRAFKLPSCAAEGHESGKDILRVCVCKAGWSSPAVPFCGGGTLSCSYSVPDHLSQCGSPVLLQQVELLLLERDATPQITTRLLREWKLLSSLSDIAEEEREVVSIERGFTSEIVAMSSCNDMGEEREVTDTSSEGNNVVEEKEEREVSGTERKEREVAGIERGDNFQFITELFPELDLGSSSNCTAGERTEVSDIETDAAYEMATQIWQEWVWVPSSSDNLEESVVADNVRDATA